jgi:hypothetical protein
LVYDPCDRILLNIGDSDSDRLQVDVTVIVAVEMTVIVVVIVTMIVIVAVTMAVIVVVTIGIHLYFNVRRWGKERGLYPSSGWSWRIRELEIPSCWSLIIRGLYPPFGWIQRIQ